MVGLLICVWPPIRTGQCMVYTILDQFAVSYIFYSCQ